MVDFDFSFFGGNTNSYFVQKFRVSGLITSEMSTQNLCPSSELKGQSKCPEVICDFFAKGWCIRGTSCRFLHINSKADNTLEGESEAAFFSKSDQIDKGILTFS